MSYRHEQMLMQHLVSRDSLEVLGREGLPEECVATEDLRRVYLWAMDRFFRGGLTKAPSVGAMRAEWGDLLDDHEIDLEDDPEDTIEAVIDSLKGTYIWARSADFNRRMSTSLAEATTEERVAVLNEYAGELVRLSTDMEIKDVRVDARQGFQDRLVAYEARSQDKDAVYGMRFGMKMLDEYTRGIHPGELAIIAAGPKVGKSFLMAHVGLKEWQAGKVPVLFTLENSVEMTLDRLAVMATRVSYRAWQQGELPPDDLERVREWIEAMSNDDHPFHILQPPPGARSVEALVKQAQILGADTLLIDQLSYLEARDERQPRHLQIREITHALRGMISSGRHKVPCLLAHQINREGVKAADKNDYLEMLHLAEGSETERTADWVFGIYRSKMEVGHSRAKFQTLAARREVPKHFMLQWDVSVGHIAALSEWVPPEKEG